LEILWQFGIFSLILVYCVKKNLATLCIVWAWSLIRNKKPTVLFERHCHATEKSEAIACARSCRSSLLTGGGPKRNNRKKWRAEEEERHKGLLTKKNPVRISKKYWRRQLPVVFAGELSGSALGVVAVHFVGPIAAVVLVVALPRVEDAAAVAATEFGRFAEKKL
jgi:hypothetical protein